MIYIERHPSPLLAPYVERIWYCCAPGLPHTRERVLPTGRTQVLFNLAADTLIDCTGGPQTEAQSPSLVMGPRTRYELIDTRDLSEIAGVVFHAAGFAPFFREHAGDLFEQAVPLAALAQMCASQPVREDLQALTTPDTKLRRIEQWLLQHLGNRTVERHPLVVHGLHLLRRQPVREVARAMSLSERRLHQLFTSEVGISPKQWARVLRFQRAVKLLHNGTGTRWDQLALDCGYYDQSHFCRDFHAFSGIDPSTYVAQVGQWANHVRQD